MQIPDRFDHLVKKTYYIHERYHVDATYVMLYHEHPLDVETLGDMIRRSDEILEIDAHRYFVVFTFTTQEQANRASLNLLQKLDRHFNDRSACIAIDSFDVAKTTHIVFSRLTQILEETRKHSYNRIENEEILDRRM